MTILLTGARGFVGKAMLDLLAGHSQSVRALTREKEVVERARVENPTVEWCLLPAADNSKGLSEVMRGVTTVIHLAARAHVMRESTTDPLAAFRAANVAGTVALARAAAAQGVRRFVFVSSIKVNGEETSPLRPFSEEDAAVPQDSYAISKWEAEQALYEIGRETGMEIVIVRPPLVYGPGVKANFYSLMRLVNKALPMPLASISNRRSMIYVENLVNALIVCATHPAAAGQSYLVSDADDVSTPELMRRIAAAMKRPCRIFPFPICVIRLVAKLLGRSAAVDRLTQSLMIDSSKIRNELGWQPPFNMSQGLTITADWFFQSNKAKKPSR